MGQHQCQNQQRFRSTWRQQSRLRPFAYLRYTWRHLQFRRQHLLRQFVEFQRYYLQRNPWQQQFRQLQRRQFPWQQFRQLQQRLFTWRRLWRQFPFHSL